MGSGAGLPGILLAIANPQNDYYLIESNGKKCSFLQCVKEELDLENVHIVHERVENTRIDVKFDLVVSRAMCSLRELVSYSHLLMGKNINCIFPKGRKYMEEINELGDIKSFKDDKELLLESHTDKEEIKLGVYPSETSHESRIIVVSTNH